MSGPSLTYVCSLVPVSSMGTEFLVARRRCLARGLVLAGYHRRQLASPS